MRVLIACEFSGVVREAFRARGHDAWSCDLLPAEDHSEFHLQRDAADVVLWTRRPDRRPQISDWDLMIAHPPCTYLCNSGVRWLDTQPGRRDRMREAIRFFNALQQSPIPRIAIENPIPHRHARELIGDYHQIIHPWQFGHGETKSTCLWLKILPHLKPTNIVEGRRPRVHNASPGPDRWKERSRTLTGIAAAMAAQWGNT